LILVAPSPVFGVEAIERHQEFVSSLPLVGPHPLDLESWRANSLNIEDWFDFLKRLAPQPCIILSGDVHYAFPVAATLKSLGGSSLAPKIEAVHRVAQLTSSATKNPTPGWFRIYQLMQDTGTFSPTKYWFKAVTGAVVSFDNARVGELATKSSPFGSERIRYEGLEPVAAIMFENNAVHLVVNENSVRHEFVTSDGRAHIPVRWSTESWPTG
jgi:hypothetical protein